MKIVAVQGEMPATAGILVYWSLSGVIDLQDLTEVLEAEGIDPKYHPSGPSVEVAVHRAAESCADARRSGSRTLVRPLRRKGAWDIVQESVVPNEQKGESLEYQALVRVSIEETDDKSRPKEVAIRYYEESHKDLSERIHTAFQLYSELMTATDTSVWLTRLLGSYVAGIPLRSRGGIYFIPRDQVSDWARIVRCVRAVSDHILFEIPALQTDEAVDAILTAFRQEITSRLSEMEAYLTGDAISTRGLNAWRVVLEQIREKTRHYAEILGVALPDLEERSTTIDGMIAVAKIRRKKEQGSDDQKAH